MWANGTDATLLLHAIFLIVLGYVILRAAKSVHERGFWRQWPPLLLTVWGVSEIADGLVYLRRFLARVTEWRWVHYEGAFSFVLNTFSLAVIVLMVWLILHGSITDNDVDSPDPWPPEGAPRV